jgi:hypothetical protein
MAKEQVIGTNAFIEQAPKRTFTREAGWSTVRTYIGPQDLAEAKASDLEVLGAESIEVQKGVPAIITASFPDDAGTTQQEDATSEKNAIWELSVCDLEKDLRTHGRFHASLASASILALIDADIERGEATGGSSLGTVDYNTLYAGFGALNEYVALRAMGVESYLSFRWTIRKTITSSRRSVLKWQTTYGPDNTPDGSIVTWDKILVPNTAKFVQPQLRIFGGPLVDSATSSAWQNFAIDSWLQKPASVQYEQSGRAKKFQMIREWIGAVSWSGTLYEGGNAEP